MCVYYHSWRRTITIISHRRKRETPCGFCTTDVPFARRRQPRQLGVDLVCLHLRACKPRRRRLAVAIATCSYLNNTNRPSRNVQRNTQRCLVHTNIAAYFSRQPIHRSNKYSLTEKPWSGSKRTFWRPCPCSGLCQRPEISLGLTIYRV